MLSSANVSAAKNSCKFCGNNPVPHLIFKINESLNILLTPLRQKILYNPLARCAIKLGWNTKLANFFLALGESLKIISRRSSPTLCKVPRAKVLWEEAEKRGIVMEELLLFGRPFDSYLAEKKNPTSLNLDSSQLRIKDERSGIIFSGLPRPEGYTNKWLDLMDDKWLFKKVMLKNSLPVPGGESCRGFRQAKNIFQRIRKNLQSPISNLQSNQQTPAPVIVKPRSGSRGRHSTTFVFHEADLYRAFKIAKQLCYWVIVEEQLFGPVYRATVINFELCGVLRGDPPQVAGDGEYNIKELIEIKNHQPHTGVKDIVIDDSIKRFLERQFFFNVIPTESRFVESGRVEESFNSQQKKDPSTSLRFGRDDSIEDVFNFIPKTGELINLSEKIGISYGGSSSEDFDICHTDNKELFVKAAKVLGDPLVGFDFIIPDIARSWQEQKCGFIEVNSLPFINLHHDPLHGRPRNVAAKVWDLVNF